MSPDEIVGVAVSLITVVAGVVWFFASWYVRHKHIVIQQNNKIRALQKQLEGYAGKSEAPSVAVNVNSVASSSGDSQASVSSNSGHKIIKAKTYRQPVLLLGPRNSGKSTLRQALHAPWNRKPPSPTQDHPLVAEIPFFEHLDREAKRKVMLTYYLVDFPGEERLLPKILSALEKVTTRLRDEVPSRNPLGTVVVCMLDSMAVQESDDGRRAYRRAMQYYNADLMRSLRAFQENDRYIERVVTVYNKLDILEAEGHTRHSARDAMKEAYYSVVSSMWPLVSDERQFEVYAALAPEDQHDVRGDRMIRHLAAEPLVKSIGAVENLPKFDDGDAP